MPTIRQKKAFKEVLKGSTISQAMVKAGYSETTASTTGKLTNTLGWNELLEKHLSDDKLTAAHSELLEQKKIEYFVFPRRMSDEDISDHVESAGLKVITIRESDKGKLAFYSIPDAQAKKAALDMAYKLRGVYAPDKTINLNIEQQMMTNEDITKLAEVLNKQLKDGRD